MRGLKLAIKNKRIIASVSHLLQMRGLKLLIVRISFFVTSRIFYRCVDWNSLLCMLRSIISVASFTDAWIETQLAQSPSPAPRSHLLQMRGLKLSSNGALLTPTSVASFTDAWIETPIWVSMKMMLLVASFTDAWIETIPKSQPPLYE